MATKITYSLIDEAPSDADTILMLHGVAQDRTVFNRQFDHFRQEYRILAIDLPGHGQSCDFPGPLGLEAYAGAVSDALEETKTTRPHLWGTHTGASVGLFMAMNGPRMFCSLILESPVIPGIPMPCVGHMFERIKNTIAADGIESAKDVWWEEGPWFRGMRNRPAETRADDQRAMLARFCGRPWMETVQPDLVKDNVIAALKGLDTPTLIMNGEWDDGDFVEAAAQLDNLLPKSDWVRISEAGGFALWEFPDQVNVIVEKYLKSLS